VLATLHLLFVDASRARAFGIYGIVLGLAGAAAFWSRLIWWASAGVWLGLPAAGAEFRDRLASWWSTRQISRQAGAGRGLQDGLGWAVTTDHLVPGRKQRQREPGPILLCMGLFSFFCVWPLRCTAEEHLHGVRDTKSSALRAGAAAIGALALAALALFAPSIIACAAFLTRMRRVTA
jgi:hypothetical protein